MSVSAADAGRVTPPPPSHYAEVWAELTGYVQQARDDGDQIDPAELLSYMAELRIRALAPICDWLKGAAGQ